MKLLDNMRAGTRYLHWSRTRACAYFIKGVARECGIASGFFARRYRAIVSRELERRWLKDGYFNFNGILLPDVSGDAEKMLGLSYVINDTFLFHCYYNDSHDRATVEAIDRLDMIEGPYGYVDGAFDVTVKSGDVVIDAGAWIGDFSAYAAFKGATAHAFEPVEETFQLLCETAALHPGRIIPVRAGLGSETGEIEITIDETNSGANSTVNFTGGKRESVPITTLDRYVADNRLPCVDFIKADIEGAERDMLYGAAGVLREFAPRLAICTYHRPDDPTVLEALILEANPAYTVRHTRHKLFAAVVKPPHG